jgi:hypothetical protein
VTHETVMLEFTNTHKFLVGKTEGKRQLGRPKGRWENKVFKKKS